MQPKQAQDMSAALAETLIEWHSVGNLATKDDILRLDGSVDAKISRLEGVVEARISEAKAEILKWMFAGIAGQTFILLGTLFGLVHTFAK